MEDSKAESSLYIETFEKEITRLCDPYTHSRYLSLLGGLCIFTEELLEDLRESLNKAIDDAFSPKDQTSSNDKGNASDQIINLKKELKDKITSILVVDQKDSSKDATSSKQPSPKEVIDVITLENDLLSLLESYPLPETIKKETVSELTRVLQDCFNEAKNKAKDSIRSIINREVEVVGETPEEGETNKDEQNANQKDKIKQEQSENGEIAEGKEESKENEQESKTSPRSSPFPKETKLPLEKRCAQLDEIIKNLWIPFSKSLLEGEFLKDTQYSIKLQAIIEKIRNTYDSTLSEDIIYFHPILLRIHELCQELSYVCQCIKIQIEPKEGQEELHNKRRVFHAPVSYLAHKPYAGGVNSGEMLKANLFHDLGKKLIEMTRIDLSGVIDDQAVSHLFLLHKQCTLLLDNKDSNLLDFPSDMEIEGIFKSIRAKTSLLLFQSFYKPDISSESHKIDIERSIAQPYERAKNFEILYEGEKYHLTGTAEEAPKRKLLHERIKGFEDLTSVPLSEDCTQGDISKYNEYIRRGKNGREDSPKDEGSRTGFLNDLLQNLNKNQLRERILHLPLDVLLSLMKELREKKESDHKQIGGPRYDNSRYAKAMRFLLKCFYERLLIYKDFVAAEQKKDEYAYSFYKLDEIDLKIFISSFGCKLLHTQALQDEVYHKYNQIYREWLSEAQEEAIKAAKEAAKEAAKKVAKKAAMEGTMEAAEEAAKETAKETERNMLSLQLDTRKEAISILSIFVALITFISGGISILQGTNSLADYLILTGTLYIFIVAIISVLYFKSIEGDQKECKMRPYSRRIILGGSKIIAIVAIIAGGFLKCAEEKTGKDDGSPKVNYGVENIKQIFLSGEQMISHPSLSDSVGFNASTNEKQGDSTDKKQKK